mmetsp:Transcript_15463/g.30845  ORF Transcript_15463/g.30845 Transcript_15463/m.30845 type:complete len:293 (+) Transcript_15463:1134-2012(+)
MQFALVFLLTDSRSQSSASTTTTLWLGRSQPISFAVLMASTTLSCSSSVSVLCMTMGYTPLCMISLLPICGVGTKAMMGTLGLYFASCFTVLPLRLMAMMRSLLVCLAMLTAAWQMLSRLVALSKMASPISFLLCPMLLKPQRLSRASSAWLTIVLMVLADRVGYWPLALSPLSMTQSAPSKTALPTSVTSARVGLGLRCMESSIWVATTTGFPARLQSLTIFFCKMRSSAKGISTPRSPLATMMPSDSARISSKLSTPSLFSILLMTEGRTTCSPLGISPSALACWMHLSR